MGNNLFRVLVIVGALLPAASHILRGQSADTLVSRATTPQMDTLLVPEGPTTQERLMAKVDSLRRALAESPERRRRAVAQRLATADSLCLAYDFQAAADVIGNAAGEADSSMSRAVELASLRAQAGKRMMSRVTQVRVSASKRISREDFFRMFPQAASPDQTRFHSVSADGRSLYFSSGDRSGAGGYDLYVSRRNSRTGEWSESVNMGFPFSSPYDDLLYAEAGDGRHSVLVSARDCTADSVNVYVLEYDPVPPRRAVGDARQLRALARLEPAAGRPAPATARRARAGSDMSAYSAKTAAVRALRDSVTAFSRGLDNLRAGLEDVAEADREAYVSRILAEERGLERLRGRLDAASRELQEIELSFLAGGTSPISSLVQAPAEPVSGEALPELFIAEKEDRTVMMLSANGENSIILPQGAFSEYVEFPARPAYRVRAVVGEDALPPLAMTVIRLHTGASPETSDDGESTTLVTGPLHDRQKAVSLMMALRATGVADISLIED